jgi:hypothetical protein
VRHNLTELQKQWYKKLADSGFEDIENDRGYLKTNVNTRYTRGYNNGKDVEAVAIDYEIKANYYRLAGQFLYEHKFANDSERNLWKYHAEGMSHREIVKKSHGRYNYSKVCRKIKKLKNIMFTKALEGSQDGTK